jgi:hypothetical protein
MIPIFSLEIHSTVAVPIVKCLPANAPSVVWVAEAFLTLLPARSNFEQPRKFWFASKLRDDYFRC